MSPRARSDAARKKRTQRPLDSVYAIERTDSFTEYYDRNGEADLMKSRFMHCQGGYDRDPSATLVLRAATEMA